jgi:hypothetical protein
MIGVNLLKRVMHHEYAATSRQAQGNPPVFRLAMLIIVKGGSLWIKKYRGSLLETHVVLTAILSGFLWIPLEIIPHRL